VVPDRLFLRQSTMHFQISEALKPQHKKYKNLTYSNIELKDKGNMGKSIPSCASLSKEKPEMHNLHRREQCIYWIDNRLE
jgi:hypothetical protein